jgi:pimeloyl-ACP methyl ester carboxylesterase
VVTRKKACAILGATILFAIAGTVATHSSRIGKLQFLGWKTLSGKAHGDLYTGVGAIPLHYETFGSGPPVLVLHGGLGSAADMRHQIRALADTHFVIAPDLPGNGLSGDEPTPLSYAVMANDMVGLLDALSIPRVDIVGWSDGGIVGLELAMHHPMRVRRLVAIGANFDPDGLSGQPSLDNLPERSRKVVEMWRTQPRLTKAMLGTIHAPTLIMAGEFDLIRRAHTDALARAIPNAEEYIIPGADHRAPLTQPDEVNTQISAFLDIKRGGR